MLPLKLLRSLVLGETITKPLLQTQQNHHDQNNDLHHHHDIDDDDDNDEDDDVHKETRRRRRRSISKTKTPLLLFLPTKELVTDTYRLATIARDMGMDLYPTPSLSHIVFSYPSSSSSSSSSSWSTSSLLSTSTSLPNDAVPLPFPSLATASLSHLRSFSTLSKGLFKLAFLNSNHEGGGGGGAATTSKASTDVINSNWNCCSISLFSRLTGDKICTMDGFIRALAGKGWTLFKTKQNPCLDFGNNSRGGVCVGKLVYLFRKVESNRVRVGWVNGDTGSGSGSGGECRVRELRLPHLDFRNAPLRILQYILLMTDDMFYLA